jgi:hypothetical protein
MFGLIRGKPQESEPLFAAPATPERERAERWLKSRIEQGKTRFFNEPEAVYITLPLAELMLQRNRENNRTMRRSKVERHKKALREGRWIITAQGVSFDKEGFLDNGQHRLTAIVESGIPAFMSVSFGHAPEAFTVLDTQSPRTAGDVLQIGGEKFSKHLASSCRMLKVIESGMPRGNLSFDNDEIRELLNDYPSLRDSCAIGHGTAIKNKSAPTPFIVAHYLISQTTRPNGKVSEFFEKLGEGIGLNSKSDPILVLRKKLATRPGKGQWGSRIEVAAFIIKAWNQWVRGRRMTSLNWKDGEGFPEVVR